MSVRLASATLAAILAVVESPKVAGAIEYPLDVAAAITAGKSHTVQQYVASDTWTVRCSSVRRADTGNMASCSGYPSLPELRVKTPYFKAAALTAFLTARYETDATIATDVAGILKPNTIDFEVIAASGQLDGNTSAVVVVQQGDAMLHAAVTVGDADPQSFGYTRMIKGALPIAQLNTTQPFTVIVGNLLDGNVAEYRYTVDPTIIQ